MLYAHVYDTSTGTLCFHTGHEVENVRLISDGSELVMCVPWNEDQYEGSDKLVFVDVGDVNLSDKIDTVIRLKLKD